ncbi:MAG: DUF5615 family PIN-like protein [Candidatus Desulfofervidaceae bacterium]|nr:DUF5615 family PIN-like protein [Candidatus Desulfofervidaceae bacterium]
MKFVADENIDKMIVDLLREEGYEVIYIPEISPTISDEEVFRLANKEKALLLTADKDFGELVFRQKIVSYGVILIRLAGLSAKKKAEIVTAAIKHYCHELTCNFTVITQKTIRIRKQFC